jgi:hypothetical protein
MPGPYTHWESTKSLFKKLFVWGIVIIGGLWLLAYWLTPEKERLAQEYCISQDAVAGAKSVRGRLISLSGSHQQFGFATNDPLSNAPLEDKRLFLG